MKMKKGRLLKSWSKHNLPDELWPEILSRLPVKSLLRFRCVSRSWKTWIDDPDFIRLHLTRFNNRPDSPILFVLSRGQCVVKNIETLRTTSSLGFLQSDLQSPNVLRSTYTRGGYYSAYWWSIRSSIDGLFLLFSRPDLMLWNPSIKKTLLLPPLPEIPLLDAEYGTVANVSFGLGFDPLIKDYKAVKIFSLEKEDVHFAAIYTLGTNSWKLIESQGEGRKELAFHRWQSSISFNGVLYGLAIYYEKSSMKLASFDLRSEVFTSSKLPITDFSNLHLAIVDDGCSLALIHLWDDKLSMWVLEGLGDDTNARNWTQRYTFVTVGAIPYQLYDYEFLRFKKNDEMLMKCNYMVVCFNLQTQQQKILMEKNKKSFEAAKTFTYMESLILHSCVD